jgi:hypothetical protein
LIAAAHRPKTPIHSPNALSPCRPAEVRYNGGMSDCHVIRLRGPWEVAPLPSDGDATHSQLPTSTRVAHPAIWPSALANYCGPVRMTRRFGRPADIEPHLSVWLVLHHPALQARVTLNGESLGAVESTEAPTQYEVTQRLVERNELTIDASPTGDHWPPGEVRQLTGDVQLEIRGEGA